MSPTLTDLPIHPSFSAMERFTPKTTGLRNDAFAVLDEMMRIADCDPKGIRVPDGVVLEG